MHSDTITLRPLYLYHGECSAKDLSKSQWHEIFPKGVQLLAYSDSINVIGHTKGDVIAAFSAIVCEYAVIGLAVHGSKINYMLSTGKNMRCTGDWYLYLRRCKRVFLSLIRHYHKK